MNILSFDLPWDDPPVQTDLGTRDRVLDHLVAALVAFDSALAELTTEEANPILPVEPDLRALLAGTDCLVKRLAH